jgi:hypothetical protein
VRQARQARPPQSTGGEQGKQQGKQTHAIDQHQRTALLQQGHVLMGAQQPAGFVAGNFARQQAQYPPPDSVCDSHCQTIFRLQHCRGNAQYNIVKYQILPELTGECRNSWLI